MSRAVGLARSDSKRGARRRGDGETLQIPAAATSTASSLVLAAPHASLQTNCGLWLSWLLRIQEARCQISLVSCRPRHLPIPPARPPGEDAAGGFARLLSGRLAGKGRRRGGGTRGPATHPGEPVSQVLGPSSGSVPIVSPGGHGWYRSAPQETRPPHTFRHRLTPAAREHRRRNLQAGASCPEIRPADKARLLTPDKRSSGPMSGCGPLAQQFQQPPRTTHLPTSSGVD